MALARCEACGKPRTTKANTQPYSPSPYPPTGHPNSGVVCGKPGCEKPGLVWLKKDEAAKYWAGQRVFKIHTHTAKVRLQ